MESYLSDDRQTVIVINNWGETEEFTIGEFAKAYGKDALPDKVRDIYAYYEAFSRLCDACGRFSGREKLKRNINSGVVKLKNVLDDYYAGDINKLEKEIINADKARHEAAQELDKKSKCLGFKPMSEKDIAMLLNHLNGGEFRKKMKYRLSRNLDKQQLASARDLTIEVMRAIKKRSPKNKT